MKETIKKVFEIFKNHEIYLVGGYVRDFVMTDENFKNVLSDDLDFTTKLKPEEIKEVLRKKEYKIYNIGEKYGTIGTLINNVKVEITTYRINEKYNKDSRNPVVEWGNSLEDDLSRRDFTFNTLALDKNLKIIDVYNGRKHLSDKTIETPADPNVIFKDDPLRILRAFRFQSRFGFYFSEKVIEGIKNNKDKILSLSKERILSEFNKILMGDFVDETFSLMKNYKVLHLIIPELTVLDVKQNTKFHHKDVWEHTLLVLKNVKSDLILKWASLFHDIAKPYCFSEKDGIIHFYNHEELGARISYFILKRIGLSNKDIEKITYIIRNHMRPNLYNKKWSVSAIRRFIHDMNENIKDVFEISKADIKSSNPEKVAKKLITLNDLIERCNNFQEKNDSSFNCPLSGQDIMDYYKIKPSKEVGRIKNILYNMVIDGIIVENLSKEKYFEILNNNL